MRVRNHPSISCIVQEMWIGGRKASAPYVSLPWSSNFEAENICPPLPTTPLHKFQTQKLPFWKKSNYHHWKWGLFWNNTIGNPAGIGKGTGFGLRERDRDGIGLGHYRLRATFKQLGLHSRIIYLPTLLLLIDHIPVSLVLPVALCKVRFSHSFALLSKVSNTLSGKTVDSVNMRTLTVSAFESARRYSEISIH